jgi:hypothetical protein
MKDSSMMRYVYISLLCVTLACGSIGCAPKLVGPTRPSGYYFSLVVSASQIYYFVNPPLIPYPNVPDSAELIVRVQNAQGQPVDGIPVEFLLEPDWTQNASLTPQRAMTRGGEAQSVFRATMTGVVRITVRVEDMTQGTTIAVSLPPDRPGRM